MWCLQGRRILLCCGTWCGWSPDPPRQSGTRRRYIWMEESNLKSVEIYAKATSRIKSRHFQSKMFASIVLIFSEPSNICLCRFYINEYHSKCTYGTGEVFEIRQTSTWIQLPIVWQNNFLSAQIERRHFNSHNHISFTCIQHIRVNEKMCQKGVGAVKVCTSYQ